MKPTITFLFMLWLFTANAQNVKDFTLTDVVTGKEISLSDYKSAKALVVIFTSNVCPYSIYYEGRITQLISEFKNEDVKFLLINAHLEDKESQSQMKNKISAWGLNIPYLMDKNHEAMKSLGARKSPEAFILKPANGSYQVFYSGAIDNNPQVASDVKNRFLRDNISGLLQGKPAKQGSRPIGCMIK